ncbi:hypothetical protein ONA23_00025 [Mycoplasmopsis cynos]|uniref:hypothetical protein n=1 Tax=Mycoplasmopsis cynos TaxID=171284 RepID=UPI0024C7B78F|nr:hypothetical protein [Mycoplasmopsis cynos]WAM06670.1 hypothetical protein ONA23_00025 [Mycoplasmopsis cynos]
MKCPKKFPCLFFVDIFPDKTGLPHLHNGTIWTKINGKNYLRLYTRLKSNDKFDDEISFLERVSGTQNWFRRVILKTGKDIKNAPLHLILPWLLIMLI